MTLVCMGHACLPTACCSCRFMSEFTGLPEERVEEESDRENFLSPEQAMALGIIDGVVPNA